MASTGRANARRLARRYAHKRKNKMITIRPYTIKDKNQINSVAINAFQQFKEQYNDWESLLNSVGNMSSLVEKSNIIVAEINNEVAGAVALVHPGKDKNKNIDPTWSTIRLLVVSTNHRSKGIGKLLTNECIKTAKTNGVKTIGLYTSPIMQIALSMYLKMGFEKVKSIGQIFGVEYAVYKLEI